MKASIRDTSQVPLNHSANGNVVPLDPEGGTHRGVSSRRASIHYDLEETILEQIFQCCTAHQGDPETMSSAVFALLDELKPQGGLEHMLVAQAISAHFVSMAQLSSSVRASSPNLQSVHIGLATKLQKIFTQQLSMLASLRGSKKQHVRVEHFYVGAGGQAIVGNVHAPERG